MFIRPKKVHRGIRGASPIVTSAGNISSGFTAEHAEAAESPRATIIARGSKEQTAQDAMDAMDAKDTLGRHLRASAWVLVEWVGMHWRTKHPEVVPTFLPGSLRLRLSHGAVLCGFGVFRVPGGLLLR